MIRMSTTLKRHLLSVLDTGVYGEWFSVEDNSKQQKIAARKNSSYTLGLRTGSRYSYWCVSHRENLVEVRLVHFVCLADFYKEI